MRKYCIAVIALAVLATAAHAGTIHYKFSAEVTTDNNATATKDLEDEIIYGWFKFETNDIEDKAAPGADMAIYEAKDSVSAGWLSWGVTIEGTEYTPGLTPYLEMITVGRSDDDVDSLTVKSTAGLLDPLFFLNFQDGDEALDGTLDFPSPAQLEPPTTGDWVWTTRDVNYVIGDYDLVAKVQTLQFVPLPAAAWAGLGLLGALGLLRRLRRRK